MNRREMGRKKEQEVCRFLEQRGYVILECNYRVQQGEIDIVARQEEYLVFVEVKYRSSSISGKALEAVDERKCRKISRTALYYMKEHDISLNQAIRFDVVAVDGECVTLLPNAFDYRR